MSLEKNKTDFEEEINNVSDLVSDMEGIVHKDITDSIHRMISEYEHLKSDIESMVDENERLQDIVDENELE